MTHDSTELTIRELARRAGVTRATIHHYTALGLLPPPRKPAPRRAYYPAAHVERIRLVKELQRDRFVPLRVARELLHERRGARELRSVAAQALERLRAGAPGRALTRAELLRRFPVGPRVLDALESAGIVGPARDGRYDAGDADLLACVLAMRRAGLDERLGFEPAAMRMYRDACDRLLDAEAKLFNPRVLGRLPPARAARLAATAATEVSRLLAALHRKLLRGRLRAVAEVGGQRGSGKTGRKGRG